MMELYLRAPGQAAPLKEKIMPRPKLALTKATLVLAPLLACVLAAQASKSAARRTTRTPSTSSALSAPSTSVQRAASSGELAIVNARGETVGVCPLKNTQIKADISGFVARVVVEQRFHNPSKEPIEAVYTFRCLPMPRSMA
jgi:Ca-activated chloride channel family protein